jgi:hypothetical protein
LNDARGIFSFGSSSSSPLTHSTNIPSPPPSLLLLEKKKINMEQTEIMSADKACEI